MSFIETERLLIRAWKPSDANAAERIFADPEVMRFIGVGGPWTSDQSRSAIAAMSDRYEREGLGIWPVVLKEDGTLIGECGLQPLPGSSDIELAYLFDKPYWGRGLAYEAAEAVLDYGFGIHGLRGVVAVVRPENARSIALLNRLGMRFDRVVRAYKRDLLKYTKTVS